ncbi:4-hydroxybenzoate 3-monooxygenase [Roseateles sp. DAIF2]|uniref:4-hydroxybenzoate 3-monooxygenase n=1 Tax=Roseateles sp. DAIF2 TaxID=2714952 RepID=UPI0018A26FA2|nr:4-hydroxybenzoate 3-monooxygenase [Roseateles sp. DAIF2]QPF75833.1 4-hydroxybenzoate 3-monooxygenase [Roseateles sp. DAIF2]
MQRTQVAIIGAGPAGLLLGALLHKAGIANQVLELHSSDEVLARMRAGILEPGTAALIDELGLGGAMRRDALIHAGIAISFGGQRHRLDLQGLSGQSVLVYGQNELTRDLMSARAAAGLPTHFQTEQLSLHDFDGERPYLRYQRLGQSHELACDFIAGCDGFHGIARASVPTRAYRCFERGYPFGWLGVLADATPPHEELVYAQHERGFALCSMRGRSRVRCYLQCSLSDKVEQWSDGRFWDELHARLDPATAAALRPAPSLEKSIMPLRSYVAEPLRFGRLFLAGDAGHLVPPTGAKGMNLAAADARDLAQAFIDHYRGQGESALARYSEQALRRVWRAERFSWGMTRLLHHFPDHNGFDQRIQQAELEHLFSSRAAQTVLAEGYVGQSLN